jgi:hypothetical protein
MTPGMSARVGVEPVAFLKECRRAIEAVDEPHRAAPQRRVHDRRALEENVLQSLRLAPTGKDRTRWLQLVFPELLRCAGHAPKVTLSSGGLRAVIG